MIARIWRGRTQIEYADEYAAYVKRTGVTQQRLTTGNLGSMVLKRVEADAAEFLVISLWDSWGSVRAFAGPRAEVAVYYPEDERYLLELEPEVRHFEVPVAAFA